MTRTSIERAFFGAALVLFAALAPSGAMAAAQNDNTYTQDEIVREASEFFAVGAEAVAMAVEHVFARYGRPNAFIVGNEYSGAIGIGGRYGDGMLNRKNGGSVKVFWQGPSLGFDIGGNVSQTFTLIYNLPNNDAIFQRFPGVEGSYYFIAGIGVNYQQAGDIILAPMRTGVGLRVGANVGYLSYTRERNILPF